MFVKSQWDMANNHRFSVLLAFESNGMYIVRVIWLVLLTGNPSNQVKCQFLWGGENQSTRRKISRIEAGREPTDSAYV